MELLAGISNRKYLFSAVVMTIFFWGLFSIGNNSHFISQPIQFNHNLHVDEQEMECEECHVQVMNHQKASLPSLEICIDCHTEPMTESESEEILLNYINGETDIPWNRIYQVPDHVYFSHRRHVTLGNVECIQCHGDVKALIEPPGEPIIYNTMDRCISCHEEHQVDNDCLACHR